MQQQSITTTNISSTTAGDIKGYTSVITNLTIIEPTNVSGKKSCAFIKAAVAVILFILALSYAVSKQIKQQRESRSSNNKNDNNSIRLVNININD
ncbi:MULTISPECIES: hypothetical protein [Candidatus Ichthyocystis]|uniref:hypothetical protein n=1 Tax=Candidatus Ichthyocystis TaxID=2929841 RepID=UPI000B822AF9|nr:MULTISPECIES: hypothetical protein [Ichthyocystis]